MSGGSGVWKISYQALNGFVQLEAARRKLGLAPDECMLGLETAHNLIIEYLWSQAYQQVYVIPPSVVKSNRNRFRQSRARDDQSDGYLLADILRTDRGRLQPLRFHSGQALAPRQSADPPDAG